MPIRSYFLLFQKGLPFLAALLMFVGLIASKALIAIASVAFVLAALPYVFKAKNWQRLQQQPLFWSPALLFILMASTALYSENKVELMDRVRVMLPLLLLPISMAILPPWPKQQWRWLLASFVLIMSIAVAAVLINYGLNYTAIQASLKHSKGMPNPANDHVRFSLLICWATILSGQLFVWRLGRWPWIWLLLGSFLFLAMHIFGARSGILAFYFASFYLLLRWLWQTKRFLIGSLGLLACLSLPFLAYKTIPSFREKILLTEKNIRLYQAGHIGNYSDTQRMLSFQVALEVWAKSPILGVGLGDLKDEQKLIYQKDYPEQRVMAPHSQYISSLAAMGVLGLLLFLGLFSWPFFTEKTAIFQLFWLLIAVSFLSENTLFITIGANLYAFFYCYLLLPKKP
ncbi:O-antigen ligase family protein [Saprospira sp. CCB-QB6]|uniref:O-antigen ligase family protein n=1 Tax=Saprospira sp. CCB-QB6 TaxID=3023936 RepID=UPI00234B3708|nr:O-antigen ligase family protein [Saprospira sp. CCB-QB6]WCL80454.1 O-antigen ligase family protein [Saprospira sp. CCB-QB6]